MATALRIWKGTELTYAHGGPVADRHLRRRAVEELTGLSRSTIYALMAQGAFPRPVRLTAKAVAWPESVIAEWLAQRQATSA
jgi:prophage regulatory protein